MNILAVFIKDIDAGRIHIYLQDGGAHFTHELVNFTGKYFLSSSLQGINTEKIIDVIHMQENMIAAMTVTILPHKKK